MCKDSNANCIYAALQLKFRKKEKEFSYGLFNAIFLKKGFKQMNPFFIIIYAIYHFLSMCPSSSHTNLSTT